MAVPDGNGVNFTVKEMFAQITSELQALNAKLGSKADTEMVVELRARQNATEQLVNTMQTEAATLRQQQNDLKEENATMQTKVDAMRMQLVVFAFSVALAAIGVALTVTLTMRAHH